jgi:transposase
MPRTDAAKRARVCCLVEEGYSIYEIAEREDIHPSTVSRISKRYAGSNDYTDKPRSGRPRAFDKREERKIMRALSSGACQTAVDIAASLRFNDGIDVSPQTIRRVLKRNGLDARIKRKKPLLKKTHRKRRLEFAKKYAKWTVEDWGKVIWSDESKFMIHGSDGRKYCWRRPGESLKDEHVVTTVKFGGGSIMVWGCITSQGVGDIHRIATNLTGELYRGILGTNLMNSLSTYNLGVQDIVFQHDNDPKHTANLTKQWLANQGIDVLSWPAQSPDLNPIEHIWDEVDRRLRRLPGPIRGQEDLWSRIQSVWRGIEVHVCHKLIATMPERIRDVIKAKGGYTRW